MKKQLLVTLLAAAVAVPMAAYAEGTYVGVNVGSANHKLTWEDGSAKEDKTAYKLYAGYEFTKNFGLEGGYSQFGKFTDNWVDGTNLRKDTFKANAFYFAATGTLPLSEQFSLFAKAGVAFNRSKATLVENGVQIGSLSENRTAPMFGIGAAYNLSKNFSVVAEYEDFGKLLKDEDANLKVNVVSVGLRYKF